MYHTIASTIAMYHLIASTTAMYHPTASTTAMYHPSVSTVAMYPASSLSFPNIKFTANFSSVFRFLAYGGTAKLISAYS